MGQPFFPFWTLDRSQVHFLRYFVDLMGRECNDLLLLRNVAIVASTGTRSRRGLLICWEKSAGGGGEKQVPHSPFGPVRNDISLAWRLVRNDISLAWARFGMTSGWLATV